MDKSQKILENLNEKIFSIDYKIDLALSLLDSRNKQTYHYTDTFPIPEWYYDEKTLNEIQKQSKNAKSVKITIE